MQHYIRWCEEQGNYILLFAQVRMLSRSYVLSSADGLQVSTSLWNLVLHFTETDQITSPWTRIHLKFCTICLSYFFFSLCFPTSLTLALFPNLLPIPIVFHPFQLSCFPSAFSPELQVHIQSAIPPPFHNVSTWLTQHMFMYPQTSSYPWTVLLMCTEVSSTPTPPLIAP